MVKAALALALSQPPLGGLTSTNLNKASTGMRSSMEADWAALNAKSEKREASRCLHRPGTKSNVGAPGKKSISRLTELSSGSLGCSELSRLAGKPSPRSASLGPVRGAQGLQALWVPGCHCW